MEKRIRPGIINGDTPHSTLGEMAKQCNILLSNLDTLHAAILPGWKATCKNFLARLHYIVIDELHTYEGAFGAHVSLVLRRLIRLAKVANCISEYHLPENISGLHRLLSLLLGTLKNIFDWSAQLQRMKISKCWHQTKMAPHALQR